MRSAARSALNELGVIRQCIQRSKFILGFLGGELIGAVSAAFVYLIARLFRRGHGTRLEVTFGVAGLVGLAMCGVGNVMGGRALVSGSVLVRGWLGFMVVVF